jgi:hypothetical protein
MVEGIKINPENLPKNTQTFVDTLRCLKECSPVDNICQQLSIKPRSFNNIIAAKLGKDFINSYSNFLEQKHTSPLWDQQKETFQEKINQALDCQLETDNKWRKIQNGFQDFFVEISPKDVVKKDENKQTVKNTKEIKEIIRLVNLLAKKHSHFLQDILQKNETISREFKKANQDVKKIKNFSLPLDLETEQKIRNFVDCPEFYNYYSKLNRYSLDFFISFFKRMSQTGRINLENLAIPEPEPISTPETIVDSPEDSHYDEISQKSEENLYEGTICREVVETEKVEKDKIEKIQKKYLVPQQKELLSPEEFKKVQSQFNPICKSEEKNKKHSLPKYIVDYTCHLILCTVDKDENTKEKIIQIVQKLINIKDGLHKNEEVENQLTRQLEDFDDLAFYIQKYFNNVHNRASKEKIDSSLKTIQEKSHKLYEPIVKRMFPQFFPKK